MKTKTNTMYIVKVSFLIDGKNRFRSKYYFNGKELTYKSLVKKVNRAVIKEYKKSLKIIYIRKETTTLEDLDR